MIASAIAGLLAAAWPYLLMAGAAFIGGSLLPISSEAALLAQIKAGLGTPWGLVLAATVGNSAGALFNWWIGRSLRTFQSQRWFPFAPEQLTTAEHRFHRWGLWTLPFSWVPLVGDVLTCIAGSLRVPLWQFLPLVTLGRGLRYAALVWGFHQFGWI